MSRIAKGDVYAALERVAQSLVQAGGEDGRISRADVKSHLEGLQGTERALTDIFFRFVDHRDHVPGATVTSRDIEKAVEYAKEKLVTKYDLNNNGLSKSEVAEMSTTGKLAVQLSRELKFGDVQPAGNGALLAKTLESKADGLLYISESDYPYKGVHLPGAAGEDGSFDSAKFLKALGLPADKEIYSIESTEEFFELYQDPDGYGYDPAEVAKYKELQSMMGSELTDLQFIQLDGDEEVEGRVFIVGAAKDGSIVGLESTRIWT
jgi:hypothetical protein